MKFQGYLENLLGSPIKIKLLRTLFKFPQKGFGIRELAAFLKVNHRSVAEAIKIFEQHNLVTIKVFGRSHAIYVNTDSYTYELVQQLLEKEHQTFQKLIALLKQNLLQKEVQLCAIFGSVSLHQEDFSSDIDILIITSHPQKIRKKVARLEPVVLRYFGNPLHTLIFNREEFNASNPKLKENILKNHFLLQGKW